MTNAEALVEIVSKATIFFLMLSFALSLDLNAFRSYFRAPSALLFGLSCQFIVLPLLAFLICFLFRSRVSLPLQTALVLLCSCPGGSASNIWVFAFGA